MRKLIRSRRTKAFLTKTVGWTTDITKALTVAEVADIEFLREKFAVNELEIYYNFDESLQWDFAVPLR
jgi:hypothetical protein